MILIRDVNEARTLEAEAEARTLEAKSEAMQFWPSKFNKFRRRLKKIHRNFIVD